MKKRVIVGMSGGVDSSVAALLLRDAGYEVVGATFMLWSGDSGCCSADDVSDARYVCNQLGIAHYVLNMKELFARSVVDTFAEQYERGLTPNPCILCNRYVKFDAFYSKAQELGFDYFATGHYARVGYNDATTRWELLRAVHPHKDQSYVLYHLTQQQLEHFLLPLGSYTKDEIRSIAEQNGLVVARKPDSQDICFVPDGDYGSFLESYTGRVQPKGCFIDTSGRVLGEHKGISRYTVGQRKGLGISLGYTAFVREIRPETGEIVLVQDENELFERAIMATDINWVSAPPANSSFAAMAKIRYSQQAVDATVNLLENGELQIAFETAQRAPTKGQAVVLYDGDRVLAGGTISRIIR